MTTLPDTFAATLLAWFDRHGRKHLPWQVDRTPYRVWVSEIMLQQTQVATVIPYFESFMARFPDLRALAAATPDEVLGLWSGLGYYSRARNLHQAARQVAERHGGELPAEIDALIALPGIGRSTAGAILAQALGQRHPILDGNVKRVLTRYHAIAGWPGRSAVEKRLWELAERHTPHERLADYTQAIMDLGATVCGRRPDCADCPLADSCAARAEGAPERYPTPRNRAALPHRATRMVLVTDRAGRFLLERRPPAGIWGGLWSLPECSSDEEPVAFCRDRLGLAVAPGSELPEFTHTFSHFRLTVRPVACPLVDGEAVCESAEQMWATPAQLADLGLPAPVRRLLAGQPDSAR